MARFVVFLRAINVGGTGIVKMETLRAALAGAGFEDVKTYGASGNVGLTAGHSSAARAKAAVEGEVAKRFGHKTVAIVRTTAQLAATVDGAPFSKFKIGDPRFEVCFLEAKPAGKLPKASPGADIRVVGSSGLDVYCARYPGPGRLVSPNAFLEKELGLRATTRSWNVVQKLSRDEPAA